MTSKKPEPCLGCIEIVTIARGLVVHDALVKRARARVARSHPVSPGRYLILLLGPVDEVEESFVTALEAAAAQLHDSLLLPQVDSQVARAVTADSVQRLDVESLGLVECDAVSCTLRAADAAVKMADVHLLQLRLAAGIGGKGVALLGGAVDAVEAALDAAEAALDGGLVAREIIRNPHADLLDGLF